jgi:hypothetical protein
MNLLDQIPTQMNGTRSILLASIMLCGCSVGPRDLDADKGNGVPSADGGLSIDGGPDFDGGLVTCTPETDLEFCARQNTSCGSSQGIDNCLEPRNVVSCGNCAGPTGCQAGRCECPSENDVQFCTRLDVECGPFASTDICGNSRNVASCGTCTAPMTCGGAQNPGVCGCTPQSDAQLCATSMKNCGDVSLTDNCGRARAVSCGTCTAPNTCGGSGTPNVCGSASKELFRWLIPSVAGNALTAVHAISPNDVWAVGELGTIVHWDGTALTASPRFTRFTLNDVFASGPRDVWAVGDEGTLLHYDGNTWKATRLNGVGNYISVWAASPNDVRIVNKRTSDTIIQQFDIVGDYFKLFYRADPARPFSKLTGTGIDDLWVYGEGSATALHFNGIDWVDLTPTTAPRSYIPVYAGGMVARNQFFCAHGYRSAGAADTIELLGAGTATRWSLNQPRAVRDLWAANSAEVWTIAVDATNVAGYPPQSRIVRATKRQGADALDEIQSNAGRWQRSIHGSSSTDVWVAGEFGQLARLNGGTFSRVSSPALPAPCTQAAFINADRGYAICLPESDASTQKLTMFDTRTGSVVEKDVFPAASIDRINAIWATGDSGVWMATKAGSLIFFDGSKSNVVASFPGSEITAIWGLAPDLIWAGTKSGRILSFNGTSWSAVQTPESGPILGFWASGPKDVYALESSGQYLHFDGRAWKRLNAFQKLKAIQGTSSTNVWAHNGVETVLRFDGKTWTRYVPFAVSNLRGLWAMSESEVYVSSVDRLFRFDGQKFVEIARIAEPILGIWGGTATEIRLFTRAGILAVRR